MSLNISMKPVVIYTMPRTRSNAALQACRRELKLNEPFDVYNLPNHNPSDNGYLSRFRTLTEYDQWNSLEHQMNQPNSVVKIFGHSLLFYYNAREWLNKAETTHEIFILIRSPREMILSELLAQHFGYTKDTEIDSKEIIIKDNQFYAIQTIFDSFLRFYPFSGKLVTFDTLPSEYFDKDQIRLQEQHSANKIEFVKNIDQVYRNIDLMLSYYQAEWKDVTGLDIFA